tara:strand:+ start:1620 stop:2597 length:978 start_codon:yes stop_codon:yes gene_type:complete
MLNFDNKKILITGGAGFIGSNIANYIHKKFPKAIITVFDKFSESTKKNTSKSFGSFKNLIDFKGQIICGDISNEKDLKLIDSKFDYIFHKAAISDTREYDQNLIFRTNINSFKFFLELAEKNNSKLIYASSGATYGKLKSPQTVGYESPENPYGYSKYVMDNMTKEAIRKNNKLKVVGLRYFNVYGRGELNKGKTASMILQLATQLLDGKKPTLFNDSDNIFRDFIYINDVVRANLKACEKNITGVFNIGTGKSRSFKDVNDILQKLLKNKEKINYIENPYLDYQFHTEANIDETKKELDFEAKFNLEDGIKDYLPEILKEYEAN